VVYRETRVTRAATLSIRVYILIELSLCDGRKIERTQFVLTYKNSKLKKEREKEEVCGYYLSTLAWSRLYQYHIQVNAKPSCLRLLGRLLTRLQARLNILQKALCVAHQLVK
jgi:hypothetical protein